LLDVGRIDAAARRPAGPDERVAQRHALSAAAA
jgi:hypothetical protein